MERQQQKQNVCVCIKSFAAAATVAVVVVADVAASAAGSNALSFIFLGAWVHGAANFQLQQFRTKGNAQHATRHMPHAACNQLQHKRKNVNANLNMFPHDVAHFERALCCLIPRHALPLSLSLSLSLSLFSLSLSLTHTHASVVISRPQRQVILLGQINCTKFLPLFHFPLLSLFLVLSPPVCTLFVRFLR